MIQIPMELTESSEEPEDTGQTRAGARNNNRIPYGKLQLGNGYMLDFDQLARLLNAACEDERGRIPQPDLAAAVGLPDRSVENLASLAQALALLTKITYKPTRLGLIIRKSDPFFDDVGTLWFLHYVIASEPRNLVWNRMVDEIVPTRSKFTREQARAAFDDLRQWVSEKSIRQHDLKELNTFLDAYIEQHFSRLAYLRKDGEVYMLAYREDVPPLVLAASIARFREKHRPGDTAVAVSDLLGAPNSPGLVFQLDEGRLRASLEQLKTQPGISLESRADLDQVRLTDKTADYTWMERYYAGR
jgi:hypothetical protein